MSAQPMLTQGIANHTESILTNLTNLIELIRGAPQAASPTALDPNVQRKLESLSSEVGNIRADLRAIKTNLVDLLDLEDADNFVENTLTTDLPAVPTTLSGTFTISSLHFAKLAAMLCMASPPLLGNSSISTVVYGYTAETLLCDAFGIKYKRAGTAFIEFCGFNPHSLFNLSMYETSGSQLAATRVFNHHKRATDLDGAGRSTATSRLAAKRHNADARKHNACADSPDYRIILIHDGRNLVVPGFPTDYEWFLKPHRRDVLYLLGEYGQDIEPEGCLERFEAFARVPEPKGRQKGVEWLL